MSELLRKFRTQFPDDTRSDHEITGSLGRKYESKGINPSDVDADFGAAFEEIKKRGTITLGTEAKRGFMRCVAQTISTGFGGGALIAAGTIGQAALLVNTVAMEKQAAPPLKKRRVQVLPHRLHRKSP
jgi:hypothetical protein